MTDNLELFFTTNIFGLLILGVMGSMLAALLIWVGKKVWNLILTQRFKLWVNRAFKNLHTEYTEGYIVGLSKESNFRQSVLVGRFIIRIILVSLFIILISLTGLTLLIVSPSIFYPIIFFIYGVAILIPIKILRRYIKYYNKLFNNIFDIDAVKVAADKYVDKTIAKFRPVSK